MEEARRHIITVKNKITYSSALCDEPSKPPLDLPD